MKRNPLTGLLLLPLLCCGCSTMDNTDKGALTGAGVGAVGGALVGSAVRAPVAGAAVGAVLGTVTGAAVGNSIDRAEERGAMRQAAAQQAAAAAQTPLAPSPSLEEVVAMKQSGTCDQVIINAVRLSPGPYLLSGPQIVWLHERGISDAVISEMQAHSAAVAPPVVYQQPAPVYIINRPPPPPPVGFGVVFRR
jgi:hypothetical protein